MLEMGVDLISVDYLKEHWDTPNLILLDATIVKAVSSDKPTSDFRIQNSCFLDIKNKFSAREGVFPNTLPSSEEFSIAARELGINNNSIIVVYDAVGIYSSARVWWLFKAMGHSGVAVLDGGLPAWIEAGFPIEKQKEYTGEKGNFKAVYTPSSFYNYTAVLEAIPDTNKLIVDARSVERFIGRVKEPRKGLRSGHIPNSVNLPYTELQENGKMKKKEELLVYFTSLVKNQEKLIFSCGSGVTACILALGASLSGYPNGTVYDGSWTEFGTLYKEET